MYLEEFGVVVESYLTRITIFDRSRFPKKRINSTFCRINLKLSRQEKRRKIAIQLKLNYKTKECTNIPAFLDFVERFFELSHTGFYMYHSCNSTALFFSRYID